ncbi:MAG TPA: 5,6-dimethylbenzimidazole synthase [Nitrospirae bacterium]|nr:5,6-dimethylbenzimidazole synthase [Nitrospirota bacterium]
MSAVEQTEQKPDNSFTAERLQGVYDAITKRRDIRSFLPDPVPKELLARVLNAANNAPSVGFMQPWDFLIVENMETRKKIQAHVEQERVHAAKGFESQRGDWYLKFKLEGIIDAPVNVLVTCDPSSFGPSVIGRNTIKETDVYSAVCAVQNLWLAARAEGLGVGWVSILKNNILKDILGIPEHIIPVAYLCIGYVDKFDDEPLLKTVGWLPKRSLDDTIYAERWGQKPDLKYSGYLNGNGSK